MHDYIASVNGGGIMTFLTRTRSVICDYRHSHNRQNTPYKPFQVGLDMVRGNPGYGYHSPKVYHQSIPSSAPIIRHQEFNGILLVAIPLHGFIRVCEAGHRNEIGSGYPPLSVFDC